MEHLRRNSLILFLLLFIAASSLWAAPPKKVVEAAPPQTQPAIGDFTYRSEGRRDPFEQLHLSRLRERKKSASVEKKGYELEELKPVGIMVSEKGRFVLMEDMQGKGILFKKGDHINPSLWITDILEGRVALAYKLKGETRRILLDVPRK